MSEQSRKRTERSSRFRRLRNSEKAVSPVVATLVLILIAVAAAAALYLWLVSFQGGVTKGIGNPGTQCTLTIGGSTTVYPLTQLAITQFEQNNSGVKVCAQQGGSTAGILSLCQGQGIDIAASSSFQSEATLAGDGCPNNVVQTTVGLDAAVTIASSNNPVIGWANAFPGLALAPHPGGTTTLSAVDNTYGGIFALGDSLRVSGAGFGATDTITAPCATAAVGGAWSCNIVGAGAGGSAQTITVTDTTTAGDSGTLTYNAGWVSPGASAVGSQIKAGTITWVGTSQTSLSEPLFSFNTTTLDGIYFEASTTTPTASAPYTFPASWQPIGSSGTLGVAGAFFWNDLLFPAGCTPVGNTATNTQGGALQPLCVQVPGATSSAKITVYDRSDNSGTEDGFATKLLGWTCGSDHQLETCAVTVSHLVGNPGMITGVSGDKTGLGFASYGFTTAPGAGVSDAAFQGTPKDLSAGSLGGQSIALLPTVANTKAGYSATSSTSPNTVYAGWRVLEYVTIGQPSGEAESFINFVSGTQVNLELTGATGYVSLYQS